MIEVDVQIQLLRYGFVVFCALRYFQGFVSVFPQDEGTVIVQGPVAGCGKRRRSLEAMPEFAEEFVSPVPCIFSESVGPLLSGAQNETRVTGLQGMADVRSLEVPPTRRPTPLLMAGLAVSPAQKPEVRLRIGRRIPGDDVDDAAKRAGAV